MKYFFPVLVTVSITIIRYKLNWVWWYTASNTSTEEAEAGMMVHTSNPSTEEAGLFQVSKSDLKISNTSTCECVCVCVSNVLRNTEMQFLLILRIQSLTSWWQCRTCYSIVWTPPASSNLWPNSSQLFRTSCQDSCCALFSRYGIGICDPKVPFLSVPWNTGASRLWSSVMDMHSNGIGELRQLEQKGCGFIRK